MGSKHTKGEWVVYNAEIDENSRIEIKTDNIISVGVKHSSHTKAVAFCGYDKNPEAIANAKLISAAPELLEVLEIIIHYYDSEIKPSILEAAEKAIGKATE